MRFTELSMGEGGCYITLFSPSDVTAFHRMASKSKVKNEVIGHKAYIHP